MRKIGVSGATKNANAKRSVARAIQISEKIRIFFLSRLSTKTPIKGPSKICGRNPKIVAIASTVADPVVSVRYRMSANCTKLEVIRENVSPVKIMAKVFFRLFIMIFLS